GFGTREAVVVVARAGAVRFLLPVPQQAVRRDRQQADDFVLDPATREPALGDVHQQQISPGCESGENDETAVGVGTGELRQQAALEVIRDVILLRRREEKMAGGAERERPRALALVAAESAQPVLQANGL